MKRIGVLALQGAFIEHISRLNSLSVDAFPVRLPHQLEGIDGLIIPGGESTTIGRLMALYELAPKIRQLAQEGLPIMGTCAGLILLAKEATDLTWEPLGLMDIQVRRNAFGRQVDSFEVDLPIPVLGPQPFHAIFIRAPVIEKVGPDLEVLSQLPDGRAVAVRQDNLLATAFHPELEGDVRFHRYFLSLGRHSGDSSGDSSPFAQRPR
ncbi:MAG TPA: pyridoxal 5'-phosphate synthase glutaminase subunit PdxT [Dehalococcoidia bacterium]|nr:pyridoxal 5'-phosphate synthase glutaminase subunit PdxT [Dehalococcoidia bacterium]